MPTNIPLSWAASFFLPSVHSGGIKDEILATSTPSDQFDRPLLIPTHIRTLEAFFTHSLQGMVYLRAAAAAALYSASTVLAQGQSSSQAGNGVSGGIACGAGSLCPESSPCCSRMCFASPSNEGMLIGLLFQNTVNAVWERTA